ncbi:MFS transporter [Sphingosinicella sp. BN140058]|uniref:spinster family MFS transporter n=1 Tax=Sphingosinicella sp. BN140058 TaxID=1892855 RepID=UPI001011E23F|nr:MFS transporter [Sphingosinicella sp. BN140058]QAY75951.1 MFS transporter [Sphingosinicella sp. BN140058]
MASEAADTPGAPPSTAPSRPGVGAYAWYALFVLVLVYVINFIDRQILSILVGDIKRDLGVSDAQIGFLYGTAFAVFYALFGIPLGRLADSWYRGRLMAIGLALWSSMTAFSGFATTFGMLATARIGVGIGEASASPAAYSMISDSFPKERRATALSIYSSGLYIGGALSLPIGGLIVSRWSHAYPDPATAPLGLAGWQAAFLAVGLPGLLLALWVLSLREPLRGASDGLSQPVVRPNAWSEFGRELAAILPPLTLISVSRIPGALKINLAMLALVVAVAYGLIRLTGDWPQWSAYGLGIYSVFSWIQSLKARDRPVHRLIWGTPTVVLLTIAFGSISFVTYATAFWLPPYVEATFYAGPLAHAQFITGMTAKEEVGLIIGWSSAFAAAAGVILGGYVSDLWRQRDPRGRLFVNMLSVVLPVPLVAFMLSTDSLGALYVVTPLAQMFSSAWVGAAVATLQDLVLPRMRATAGATYILGTTMVGLALGPYFAGKMSMLTGGLGSGIACLFVMPPLTLLGLWFASRRIADLEATKVERARAAGETI